MTEPGRDRAPLPAIGAESAPGVTLPPGGRAGPLMRSSPRRGARGAPPGRAAVRARSAPPRRDERQERHHEPASQRRIVELQLHVGAPGGHCDRAQDAVRGQDGCGSAIHAGAPARVVGLGKHEERRRARLDLEPDVVGAEGRDARRARSRSNRLPDAAATRAAQRAAGRNRLPAAAPGTPSRPAVSQRPVTQARGCARGFS